MAAPQFKNMNELTDYLSALEQRVQTLEAENQDLRMVQSDNTINDRLVTKFINRQLPRTNLLNLSFLKRSFAVWGHFMVANLIIGAIGGAFYLCIMLLLLGSLLGNVSSGQ